MKKLEDTSKKMSDMMMQNQTLIQANAELTKMIKVILK